MFVAATANEVEHLPPELARRGRFDEVFFVDATVTLVRRGLRGERVHEAHRPHAYQWLARRWQAASAPCRLRIAAAPQGRASGTAA